MVKMPGVSKPPSSQIRKILTLLLMAAVLGPGIIFAEQQQALTIDSLIGVSRDANDNWLFVGSGKTSLDIKSTGNRSVKAQFTLDASLGQNTSGSSLEYFSVKRAFIKTRIPITDDYLFRMALGKTRLSWGDGAYYNAGDVLFGSSGSAASFTTTEGDLRTETDWMLNFYFPMGDFGFLEPVFIIPEQTFVSAGVPSLTQPKIDDASAGIRMQTKILENKVEIGSLTEGTTDQTKPYLSIQGNLLADIYGAVSVAIPHNQPTGEKILDSMKISAGLLSINKFDGGEGLNFRLESIITPKGDWSEGDLEKSVSGKNSQNAGIYLFPEIVFAPESILQFIARSIISPVDLSALFTFGGSINMYQGFTLYNFYSIQAGEIKDVYGFEKAGGVGIAVGASFTF